MPQNGNTVGKVANDVVADDIARAAQVDSLLVGDAVAGPTAAPKHDIVTDGLVELIPLLAAVGDAKNDVLTGVAANLNVVAALGVDAPRAVLDGESLHNDVADGLVGGTERNDAAPCVVAVDDDATVAAGEKGDGLNGRSAGQ